MKRHTSFWPRILFSAALLLMCIGNSDAASGERRFLYVAEPGIRDYLEYGGHGILIFDIDDGHKFVKRLASAGLNNEGVPLNVKGIAANAGTARLYVTTTETLMSFDLVTGKL